MAVVRPYSLRELILWSRLTHRRFNAWLPTVVFLQTEGPSFRKGFPTVLASGALACIAVFVMWRLHKRQLAQEEMQLDEATTAENLDREKAPEEAETGKNVAQLSVLPVA